MNRKKLNRNYLIEDIAESIADGIELSDLIEFYKEHQIKIYSKMNNKDLIEAGQNCLEIDICTVKAEYYE